MFIKMKTGNKNRNNNKAMPKILKKNALIDGIVDIIKTIDFFIRFYKNLKDFLI